MNEEAKLSFHTSHLLDLLVHVDCHWSQCILSKHSECMQTIRFLVITIKSKYADHFACSKTPPLRCSKNHNVQNLEMLGLI
jgi:hypothetical protein